MGCQWVRDPTLSNEFGNAGLYVAAGDSLARNLEKNGISSPAAAAEVAAEPSPVPCHQLARRLGLFPGGCEEETGYAEARAARSPWRGHMRGGSGSATDAASLALQCGSTPRWRCSGETKSWSQLS